LPIIVLIAILTIRRELLYGSAIAILIFAGMWGRLFLPVGASRSHAGARVRALSFNALASNKVHDPLLGLIRDSGADVVFIQELNYELSASLQDEFISDYPFQLLEPSRDVSGMGVISRWPLSPTGQTLQLKWVGQPQLLDMDLAGTRIRLVNFHMWPLVKGPLKIMSLNFRAREAQALFLADYARLSAEDFPVLMAGDMNATPQNDAYR
jgi:endonuclease/exonuclease/phosphatase (EEP) superfamily protein YafD